jgi:hypothetical protein
MKDEIATHDAPARRSESNFLIFADLAEWGLAGRWEQIWAKQVTSDEFVLCCIPFFTYGLALGDRVLTSPAKGRKFVISRAHVRCGHHVARIWLKDAMETAVTMLDDFLESSRMLYERRPPHLVAIDVSPEQKPAVEGLMRELSHLRCQVEWGD